MDRIQWRNHAGRQIHLPNFTLCAKKTQFFGTDSSCQYWVIVRRSLLGPSSDEIAWLSDALSGRNICFDSSVPAVKYARKSCHLLVKLAATEGAKRIIIGEKVQE